MPIFLLLALLVGCKQEKKEKYSYKIAADIKECKDCYVRLFFMHNSDGNDLIDSTAARDGRFTLQGKIAQPGFYMIRYQSQTDENIGDWLTVYLPADSVHIKTTESSSVQTKFYKMSDGNSPRKQIVISSPSPLQEELEQYLLLKDSLDHQFQVDKELIKAKFVQTFDSGDKALVEQWADSIKNFEYRFPSYLAVAAHLFIQQHPASVVSLYAMFDNRGDLPSVERFRRYYQAMPTELQQSFYGKRLNKALAEGEERNVNNQRFVGQRVQSLAGKTPDGQELNAAQVFQQNKLTLVEFWASWCGPCRMEMPKYYGLHKQYQGRGFGMVGVSLDTNHNKWRQAIAEDSLQMPHLSELKGTSGEDMQRFGINAIPANLLVDETGKIVAVDIPYPKLKKKLQGAL
ncbi:AhpC/TSA family protein [Hymenobacter sp. BT507]|uniref:AhpC/TSA family protein n=1 Tax=Hymenobacter citatus TaxID=2763506 RepID=A0ABR7MJF4_9BACT|nr:AhpC/TSA family protein [Hymenobacter citatus]